MKCIYKYVVPLDGGTVEMPRGARIKHVGAQGGDICLWAIVDPECLAELRHFCVYGTGHEILLAQDDESFEGRKAEDKLSGRYLGTAVCGEFVWHVFEKWQDR